MRHYIVLSYLSIFQKELEVFEYKQKISKKEKQTYGILTNEAGIQAILDCILEDVNQKEATIDIFYFQSDAVSIETQEKRNKFVRFYSTFKENEDKVLDYIEGLKKDISNSIDMEAGEALSESSYYERRVESFAEEKGLKVKLHPIKISENTDMVDANKEQITQLFEELEKLKNQYSASNRDFNVFIDTSGGPRDFSFLCIMLIKLLELLEYVIRNIIYSNVNKIGNEIVSIDSTYEMLEITSGINEFIQCGRVTTLRRSLGRNLEKNSKNKDMVDVLLNSMEEYSNSISICNLEKLESTFSEIDSSKNLIESTTQLLDSRTQIMKLQFPLIRKKMGISDPERQFTILLKSYIENNMLQQAVTFYNEKMPSYLMKILHMMQVNGLVINSNKKNARTQIEAILHGLEIEHCFKSIQEEKKGKTYEFEKRVIGSIEFATSVLDTANEMYRRNPYKNESNVPFEEKLFSTIDPKVVGLGNYSSGVFVLSNISSYSNIVFPNGNQQKVVEILKDYLVIREIRNHMNHVSEKAIINNVKASEFYGFKLEGDGSLYDCIQKHLENSYDRLIKLEN